MVKWRYQEDNTLGKPEDFQEAKISPARWNMSFEVKFRFWIKLNHLSLDGFDRSKTCSMQQVTSESTATNQQPVGKAGS